MGTLVAHGSRRIDWGTRRGGRYAIREVVARTSVPSSSIHHYRRAGLIPEPERVAPNRFVYDDRHLAALTLVRSLRRQGRSLTDIRDALPELVGDDIDTTQTALASRAASRDGTGARSRLVEAAVRAFGEKGYRDISVDSLCADAGVAKGTFYRHFEGKDALFLAAAAAAVEQAIDGFALELDTDVVQNHAALLASHLRPGLPVLLELAKRSIQTSGATAHTAASLFYGLAERLGRLIGNSHEPEQAGGLVIVLAVVDIFARLVESELPDAPDGVDPVASL